MTKPLHVLALVKGGERFVFIYDERSISSLLQTFGQYASDPELNFNWYDAATLSQRLRAEHRDEFSKSAQGPHQTRRNRVADSNSPSE